jgi:hypothetical protein
MNKAQYGVGGLRSGTVLLKLGRIHWNGMSDQETDKYITQDTEVNIRSDCTIDEQGTKFCEAR